MIPAAIALAGLLCALLPLALLARNLRRLRAPAGDAPAAVSVIIPARDEEDNLDAALAAALPAIRHQDEIIVVDDGSRDRTRAIADRWAATDLRVRVVAAPPPPPGWAGKPHACAVGAAAAAGEVLLFVDADVRLAPGAAGALAAALAAHDAALVSGLPRQETGSWLEAAVVPLMHLVLYGFLPMGRMRRSRHPAYGAAVGQVIAVRAAAYRAAGGHGALRGSLHDGIDLARAVRRAGGRSDLVDLTAVATCRMYHGVRPTWAGFAKNAHRGLGSPSLILPATLVLGLGQVAPWLLLPLALVVGDGPAALLAAAALAAGLALRGLCARRFRQPARGVLLHAVGVAALLAIQWQALLGRLAGRPARWKGRSYARTAAVPPPAAGVDPFPATRLPAR